MDNKQSILDFMRRIRSLVNKPHKHHQLIQDKQMWSQLVCSMDMIEHTESAIRAYQAIEFPDDNNHGKLLVFGLLQSMFVQQDATKHLAESLDTEVCFKKDEKVQRIRDIRNDLIGHPTQRGKENNRTYHMIASHFTKYEFVKRNHRSDGTRDNDTINVLTLIQTQSEAIADALDKVADHLETEMKEHYEKFSSEKLKEILSQCSYLTSKWLHTSERSDDKDIARAISHLGELKKILDSFKSALEKRGELSHCRSLVRELPYPMSELRGYYEAIEENKTPQWDSRIADIIADHVCQSFHELERIAAELDNEYMNKPFEAH